MLILSRRCNEEIVIDDQVYVKVLSTSGGKVKVGIVAPPDVPIRRSEQFDRNVLDCGPVLISEAEAVVA
ncbi:MAG: carbon storage regulator [Planctomycetaceae bacterium]